MDKWIGYLLCGGFIGMATFIMAQSRDTESKIKRIYTRLDQVKDSFEEKHVSKELFQLLHKQVQDDINEIKIDLKTLLRKNGFNVK